MLAKIAAIKVRQANWQVVGGSSISDTPSAAEQEYIELERQWGSNKRRRAAGGTIWLCGICSLHFPPEGFGAERTDNGAIYEHCISPGSWRRCIACKLVHSTQSDDQQASHRQVCASCTTLRIEKYSSPEATVCSACSLQGKFDIHECSKCGKVCLPNSEKSFHKMRCKL